MLEASRSTLTNIRFDRLGTMLIRSTIGSGSWASKLVKVHETTVKEIICDIGLTSIQSGESILALRPRLCSAAQDVMEHMSRKTGQLLQVCTSQLRGACETNRACMVRRGLSTCERKVHSATRVEPTSSSS